MVLDKYSRINIIVNYGCTHVLLYAKMLKKLKLKNNSLFCDIFIIVSISIGGKRPLEPPSGYAYVDTKYYVNVDGAWGRIPQPLADFEAKQ